jgi:anti-anti-sigma factor
MSSGTNLIDLLKLPEENGFVRMQVAGRISRTSWPVGYDPLVEQCGSDVYSKPALINLARADYIDSSGVGWFLTCHKRFKEAGGKMVLHTISPFTMQFLKLMRMDLVLNFAVDEAAARQKAQGENHA